MTTGDHGPDEAGPLQAASQDAAATRCGFVALNGAPKAVKSTLINKAVGTKVSIVSRKVQTTRALVRGIALNGPAQIIFVDTPGIFAPKRRLDRAMVSTAWSGAGDADVAALLVDARKGEDEETQAIVEGLGRMKGPKVLILNKIDTIEAEKLLELSAQLNKTGLFMDTFMISALKGHGVHRVVERLAEMMPPGPWLYPEDQVSDAPIRALAAEITREKLFERLHDESVHRRDRALEGPAQRLRPRRADDFRDSRGAQENRDR
jgi:GTP-binding protein Era